MGLDQKSKTQQPAGPAYMDSPGGELPLVLYDTSVDYLEAAQFNHNGVMQFFAPPVDMFSPNQAPGPAFTYWEGEDAPSLPYACSLSGLENEKQLTYEAVQSSCMAALPPYLANFSMHNTGGFNEVGTAAWAEAVKHAGAGTESTADSPSSDDWEIKTQDSYEDDVELNRSMSPLQPPQQVLFDSAELRHSTSADNTASCTQDLPPVRHTFIHFETIVPLTRCASAPGILAKVPFCRKINPEMQALHVRGDCRPCAYFVHKEDGCRWGDECQFCHLCPAEAVKQKKKEKVKALKAEAALQMQRYRSSRNYNWKWSAHGRSNRRHSGK